MDTSPTATPRSADHPLLELDGVSRVYGEEVEVYALRDVSLQIFPGDFMSIVGPSGSGKSTMLGLLGVLDLPTSGTIRIAGQDVSTLDDPTRSKLRGNSIGFVFQQFHLIPHLTALWATSRRRCSIGSCGPRTGASGPTRRWIGSDLLTAPITDPSRCRAASSNVSPWLVPS